jgi:hypothetical protein
MTEKAKTGRLRETSASITRMGGAIRPRAAAVAANSGWQRLCASDRKTLSLSVRNLIKFPDGIDRPSITLFDQIGGKVHHDS